MYQHIESLKEKTANLISKELYNSYKAEIREHYLRFEKLREKIDAIFQSEQSPAKIAESIHDILVYDLYNDEGTDYQQFSESFNKELINLFDEIPEKIVMEQKPLLLLIIQQLLQLGQFLEVKNVDLIQVHNFVKSFPRNFS